MRSALSLLAVIGVALGTAVPIRVSREYNSADACVCPWAVKERGTNIAQAESWYQCAYVAGACTWDKVSNPPIASRFRYQNLRNNVII